MKVPNLRTATSGVICIEIVFVEGDSRAICNDPATVSRHAEADYPRDLCEVSDTCGVRSIGALQRDPERDSSAFSARQHLDLRKLSMGAQKCKGFCSQRLADVRHGGSGVEQRISFGVDNGPALPRSPESSVGAFCLYAQAKRVGPRRWAERRDRTAKTNERAMYT